MSTAAPFSYEQAVDALTEALTFGVNPSLEPIRALTEEMGRPQDAFASIQVTGTNGKSSVTRLTAAILEAHGVQAGAYTSPELHSYTERVACGGEPISEELFAAAVAETLDAARRTGVTPTEFEILTAAALWAFRECGVQVAVLEVGMGGRWDATSVVDPAVAAITSIALDHTAYLGETREEIAADKVHIIKPGSAVILGPGTAGIERAVRDRMAVLGADLPVRAVRLGFAASPFAESETERFAVTTQSGAPDGVSRVDVAGKSAYNGIELHAPGYQAANVATAVAAAEAFLGRALDAEAVRTAVAAATFPGRFEVIARDPWLIVDAAHNPEAAGALARAITAAFSADEAPPTIVLGVLADKDAAGIVKALAPVAARFVCVAPDSPRALPAAELAAIVERVTGEEAEVAASVAEGVLTTRASGADIVVTGSIRTVAEATQPGSVLLESL
jgi:dihydrofolate synthase / folylpolyglutamate synthase